MARIMIVDDEPVIIDTITMLIRRMGHSPISARKGEQAITTFRKERPHIMILDLGLPDISGLDVLKRIREFHPDTPIVILTGDNTENLEREARSLGVWDFVLKGSNLGPLKEIIERLMKT